MRLARARSSGPAASPHTPSSVDCITTTSASEFSVHTGISLTGCHSNRVQARFSNLDFYFTARSAEEGLITDESLIILLSRECSLLTPSHASACLMDGLIRSRERTHVPTQRKTRAVH